MTRLTHGEQPVVSKDPQTKESFLKRLPVMIQKLLSSGTRKADQRLAKRFRSRRYVTGRVCLAVEAIKGFQMLRQNPGSLTTNGSTTLACQSVDRGREDILPNAESGLAELP